MVDRLEAFNVTIPAGTAQASPVTTALTFPDGVVTALQLDIPPGPCGLMGFALQHSQQQIIPRTANTWIIANDRHIEWPLSDYPTGGKWALVGYNTDIYPHTVYVTFLLNETSPGAPPPLQLQVIQ